MSSAAVVCNGKKINWGVAFQERVQFPTVIQNKADENKFNLNFEIQLCDVNKLETG